MIFLTDGKNKCYNVDGDSLKRAVLYCLNLIRDYKGSVENEKKDSSHGSGVIANGSSGCIGDSFASVWFIEQDEGRIGRSR